jgi:hypothetical protein
MKKIKITIEATKKGWTKTVEFKGKTYTEEHQITSFGAEQISDTNIYDSDLPDEIKEELGDIDGYDMMRIL